MGLAQRPRQDAQGTGDGAVRRRAEEDHRDDVVHRQRGRIYGKHHRAGLYRPGRPGGGGAGGHKTSQVATEFTFR